MAKKRMRRIRLISIQLITLSPANPRYSEMLLNEHYVERERRKCSRQTAPPPQTVCGCPIREHGHVLSSSFPSSMVSASQGIAGNRKIYGTPYPGPTKV
jgi:hypothetical protein